MNSYREPFLQELRKSIKNIIGDSLGPPEPEIGVWIFWYNPNKRRLETFDFIGIDGKVLDDRHPLHRRLHKTFIRKGLGSIGYVAVAEDPVYIEDTFTDPRGTVVELDREIGQRSALCIPIRQGPGGTLIILDIFSETKLSTNRVDAKHLSEISDRVSDMAFLSLIFDKLAWQKIRDQKELNESPLQEPGKSANEVHSFAAKRLLEIYQAYMELLAIGISSMDGRGENQRIQYLVNMQVLLPYLESKLNWCALDGRRCSVCGFSACLFRQVPLERIEVVIIHEECPLSICATVFFKPGIQDAARMLCTEQVKAALRDYLNYVAHNHAKKVSAYLNNSSNIESRKIFVESVRFEINELQRALDKHGQAAFISIDLFVTHKLPGKYKLNILDSDGQVIWEPEYYFMQPSSFMPVIWGANFVDQIREYIENYPPAFLGFNWKIASGLNKGSEKLALLKGTTEISMVLGEDIKEHLFSYAHIPNNGQFCDLLNDLISQAQDDNRRSEFISAWFGLNFDQIMSVPIPVDVPAGPDSLVLDRSDIRIFVSTEAQPEEIRSLTQPSRNIIQLKTSEILKLNLQESVVRTAITTIMSRNMSHNLGSHVLNALAEESTSPADDRYLFRYLQHRMDYIAQVATEVPKWSSPMWFLHDIMLGFYSQKHIQEYIAKAESLRAHVHSTPPERVPEEGMVGKNDAREFPITIEVYELAGGIKKIFVTQETRGSTDSIKDIQIAVPGGIVGAHAFYTILENIIRNSAKHNHDKLSNARGLNISIQVEKRNDNIILLISDNVSDIFSNIEEKDAEKFLAYVGEPNPPAALQQELELQQKNGLLHWRINQAIRAPLVDPMGRVQKENWGIAEMRISAGFLNRCNYSQIGNGQECYFDEKQDHGFIKAVAIPTYDKKLYLLGYSLRVAAPKEILILAESLNYDETVARNNGIYVEKRIPEKGADFDFILMDDKSWKHYIEKGNQKILFPCRILRMTGKAEYNLNTNKECENLKRLVYQQWIEKILHGNKISMDVIFDTRIEPGQINREAQFINTFLKDVRTLVSLYYQELANTLSVITQGEIPEMTLSFKWKDGLGQNFVKITELCNQSGLSGIHLDLLYELISLMYVMWLDFNYPNKRPNTVPVKLSEDKTLANTDNRTQSILSSLFEGVICKGTQPLVISYYRHMPVATIDAGLMYRDDRYQEGLSGSQVLYNLLVMSLMRDDIAGARTVMNLIENGYFRVAIFDERIIRFCKKTTDIQSSLINS